MSPASRSAVRCRLKVLTAQAAWTSAFLGAFGVTCPMVRLPTDLALSYRNVLVKFLKFGQKYSALGAGVLLRKFLRLLFGVKGEFKSYRDVIWVVLEEVMLCNTHITFQYLRGDVVNHFPEGVC